MRIEQAYDRDSVRRYVAAVRGVVGSDQLGEATAAAAQVIPGEGDPQAKVRAVLPGPGTADVSSGGAEGQMVPYLSREPAVSLVQSAVSGALREQGVVDRTPLDRSLWSTITHTAEALLHPGTFSPADPDWVIKIARSMLSHLARGNHPFNPRPAEHAISDSARLVVVGDWGTGLPRARAVASYMAEEVADALACGGGARHPSRRCVLLRAAQRNPPACARLLAGDAGAGPGRGDVVVAERQSRYVQRRLRLLRDASGRPAVRRPALGRRRADQFLPARRAFVGLRGPGHVLGYGRHVQRRFRSARRPASGFRCGNSPGAPGRKLVLLSHHQLMSVYEQADLGPVLPAKLGPVLDSGRVAAWWWGHEHRCMGFEAAHGVRFPRCLGHGGVPVLQTYAAGDPVKPPGVWEAAGFLEDTDGDCWARFGFAVLDLDGSQMQVRYRDDRGAEIRREVIE